METLSCCLSAYHTCTPFFGSKGKKMKDELLLILFFLLDKEEAQFSFFYIYFNLNKR